MYFLCVPSQVERRGNVYTDAAIIGVHISGKLLLLPRPGLFFARMSPNKLKEKTSDKRPQRNARHFVCQVRNRQPWNKLTTLIPKTFVLFVPAGKLRGGLFRNEEIVGGLKYLEASNCRVAGPGIGQLEFGAYCSIVTKKGGCTLYSQR